jgi:hypothetical protein
MLGQGFCAVKNSREGRGCEIAVRQEYIALQRRKSWRGEIS